MIACAVTGLAACHRTKHYRSRVEITRSSVSRRDAQGKPETLDLEFTYFDCPGTQIEVVRGDARFAECASKMKLGDKVPVEIDHAWAPEGHFTWTVTKVGECSREPDPNDEGSFGLVRECTDWTINGAVVGFECKYAPEKHLVAQCPWFRRR